jgi:hypothetical protein
MFFLKSLPAHLFQASLLATAAIGVAFPGISLAQLAAATTATSTVFQASPQTAPQASSQTVLADGTYLFGQSPNPNEPGSDYAVFSVKNNQTVGAFYQPNSSFDCFSGEISPNRLAVDIVESYTQTSYPYAIAVTTDDTLTAGGAAGAYTLKGFHQIDTISTQDQAILAVCEADFAK